jgi:hypothetical protein
VRLSSSFDALDAYAQSVFWSGVLGFTEDPSDPNEPGHQECLIMSRDRSQRLLFITVPDGKKLKNRVHLDLRPADRAREQVCLERTQPPDRGPAHSGDIRRYAGQPGAGLIADAAGVNGDSA